MRDNTRFIGLDVSKQTIAVAVAPGAGAPYFLRTIPNLPDAVVALVRELQQDGAELECCYEAGPTGVGLQRQLTSLGVPCLLAAPSLIPKAPGDRVKTDRRDALMLARLLRSGDLHPAYVPTPDDEALRDLTRARESAQSNATRTKNYLTKLLLRWGVVEPPEYKTRWTDQYWRWLRTLRFPNRTQMVVFAEAILAVEQASERVRRLDEELVLAVEVSPHAAVIQALQGLRGFALITAASVAAEIGDFRRFETPRQLMGYTGLGARESSSGSRRRRGSITRTGNTHLRHYLVEGAWHHRHPPRPSKTLANRRALLSPAVRLIVEHAEQRLCRRFQRLSYKKLSPVVAVAVARELAGFVWAVAQATYQEHEAA
jgi:transposase